MGDTTSVINGSLRIHFPWAWTSSMGKMTRLLNSDVAKLRCDFKIILSSCGWILRHDPFGRVGRCWRHLIILNSFVFESFETKFLTLLRNIPFVSSSTSINMSQFRKTSVIIDWFKHCSWHHFVTTQHAYPFILLGLSCERFHKKREEKSDCLSSMKHKCRQTRQSKANSSKSAVRVPQWRTRWCHLCSATLLISSEATKDLTRKGV